MKSRRDFIKTASIATAGGLIIPQMACQSSASKNVAGENKTIGIQIYTVRDQISEDLEGTLQKVAEIGYKNIEAYGYGNRMILGKTPTEFRNLVEGLGMKMPSSHTVTELSSGENKMNIMDEWKVTVEDMHTAGAEYLAYAFLQPEERESLEDYKIWAERFNNFGEICNDAGIRFGYHNHDFDFIQFDGKKGYDLLLDETDPGLVTFELDLYWIGMANEDPVAYFEKHPGRFELWHIKDIEDSEDKFFAEVGQGTIDFERIFKARETAGMKLFFVEQDSSRRDIFESITMSFNYMNSAEFV